jgi:hypothetical protein
VLYDDVKVYKSRAGTALVSIGNSAADVRYQNPDPSTPSCRIKSVVTDSYNNVSIPGSLNVNIDWSPPAAINQVNDGTLQDIDTSGILNQLSANWASSGDMNSGIAGYFYCAGTSAGDSNIIPWTGPINNTFMTQSINLQAGATYFISAKAMNGAGLISPKTTSDGLFIYAGVDVPELSIGQQPMLCPNPFNSGISLFTGSDNLHAAVIEVFDLRGMRLAVISSGSTVVSSGILHLSASEMNITEPGTYLLRFRSGDQNFVCRIVFLK